MRPDFCSTYDVSRLPRRVFFELCRVEVGAARVFEGLVAKVLDEGLGRREFLVVYYVVEARPGIVSQENGLRVGAFLNAFEQIH